MTSEAPANARTVRYEWAEWDLTNDGWKAPMRVTFQEFRPDGKLSFSEDGSAVRVTYSYDDAGLLTESQFYNGDSAAGRQTHFYDDRGRLIRQVQHGPDGTERVGEELTYAADGSSTRVTYSVETEGHIGYYCPVDGTDLYLTAEGAISMTTAYDNAGRVSEVLLKSADGAVLRRLVLTRDESGRMVKYELDPGTALMCDLQGRVEEMRRKCGVHEQRVTTQCDDRGNWTERVTSHRQGENPDFTPCSIERREIAYYGDSGE